jgi:hypothetical protein
MFENRVLRRIFGPKKNELIVGWIKLHNEALRNLYSSPNIIRMIKSRRIRLSGHEARMGEKRNTCMVFLRQQGGRPLGRPRLMWENNIKMDRREIGCSGMDWIGATGGLL